MSWVDPPDPGSGGFVDDTDWDALTGDLKYLKGQAGAVAIEDGLSASYLLSNGMRAQRHPYAGDRHIESGVATTSSGVAAVSFTSAFAGTPNVTAVIVSSSGVSTHFAAIQSPGTTGVTVLSIGLDGNASGSCTIYWIAEGA